MAEGGGAVILFADAPGLSRALASLPTETTPVLRTAPHAAHRLGPRYLKAVLDRCNLPVSNAVIDCGDDAGLVMKAMAAGWRRVAFSGSPDLALKLSDLAAKRNGELLN